MTITTKSEALQLVRKRAMEVQEKIDALRSELSDWDMVREAVEQEGQRDRQAVVVDLSGTYVATCCWEVNPANGFVTVQLVDGSILPTRLGTWCFYADAAAYFGIERGQIIIDGPKQDTA